MASTNSQTPTTDNPTTSKAPKRTLSQLTLTRNPDSDAILVEIEDTEVVVTAVESEQRQGKRRKYWMSKVTLSDGRTFLVAGKAIAEPFSYLTADDFPIGATFYREPSDFEPGASYWAVK